MKIYYNDAATPSDDYAVATTGCYYKAGCYTQSNVSRGDAADAYGEVVIYDVRVDTTDFSTNTIRPEMAPSEARALTPATSSVFDAAGRMVGRPWVRGPAVGASASILLVPAQRQGLR